MVGNALVENNIYFKIHIFIMLICIPIYLYIIKFKKKTMDKAGSIIFYIINIIIILDILYLYRNKLIRIEDYVNNALFLSGILYIFYVLYILSLIYKYWTTKKFDSNDRNIVILIIISIIIIEFTMKGTYTIRVVLPLVLIVIWLFDMILVSLNIRKQSGFKMQI